MDVSLLRVVLHKYAFKEVELTGNVVQPQVVHRGAGSTALVFQAMERKRLFPRRPGAFHKEECLCGINAAIGRDVAGE